MKWQFNIAGPLPKTYDKSKVKRFPSIIDTIKFYKQKKKGKILISKNKNDLKAIAMSFPNFSRALSMISRGDAFSSSLANCSKSSSPSTFSATSAKSTINHVNNKSLFVFLAKLYHHFYLLIFLRRKVQTTRGSESCCQRHHGIVSFWLGIQRSY